jgi:hypothetical protein
MIKDQLRIGTQVHFGRIDGEKTLGEIVKLNHKTAKIRQLQPRTNKPVGTIWNVEYSLITATFINQDPIPYNPHDVIQNLLLSTLDAVFQELNKAKQQPPYLVNKQKLVLARQIAGIRLALGFEASEAQVNLWKKQQ